MGVPPSLLEVSSAGEEEESLAAASLLDVVTKGGRLSEPLALFDPCSIQAEALGVVGSKGITANRLFEPSATKKQAF